jgi:uncharacterized RDD family membrane protein YckC
MTPDDEPLPADVDRFADRHAAAIIVFAVMWGVAMLITAWLL